ncbi:hypothetical protein MMC24_001676 [Lignoscripta atroalba]|nr:hypothetical protein [Lignoscripta atroalba]
MDPAHNIDRELKAKEQAGIVSDPTTTTTTTPPSLDPTAMPFVPTDFWTTPPHSQSHRRKSASPAVSPTLMASTGTSTADRPTKKYTCWYWWKWHNCRYTEEKCLYSHCHTGNLAKGPMHPDKNPSAIAALTAQDQKLNVQEIIQRLGYALDTNQSALLEDSSILRSCHDSLTTSIQSLCENPDQAAAQAETLLDAVKSIEKVLYRQQIRVEAFEESKKELKEDLGEAGFPLIITSM